jgi:hypothetical protein
MAGRIARICRYPVKGLSPDDLEEVRLEADRPLPHDRRFAIARATARIDASDPEWMEKTRFHTLLRDARLGQLDARYDAESTRLTLYRKGRQVTQATLADPMGRMMLGQFFAAYLGESAAGAPKVVDAGERTLSDQAEPRVSLLNLASVRDLERVTGCPVNPVRFRANLHLEGLPAWSERAWPGARIDLGGARLEVLEAIERCAATEVNPQTGERDLKLVRALQRGYGRVQMGVYARVTVPGPVALGDRVDAPE